MQAETIRYPARIHTAGGRDGAAHSDAHRLDVKLVTPGTTAAGTNPAQRFAGLVGVQRDVDLTITVV